ncbi:MAG: hypothetical protein QFB87_00865 [Patescibacteria group bacterium]|nr:hypothetical protein [Patescibacteria group bacterium]
MHQPPAKQTVKTGSTPVSHPQNTIDYSPATKADNNAADQRKTPEAVVTPTPTKQELVATITRASVDSSSHEVYVGTLVTGSTTGDCAITASQVGQPDVIKKSSIRYTSNAYDCGTLQLSFDDFPNSGEWSIKLTVTSGGSVASNTWGKLVTINRG